MRQVVSSVLLGIAGYVLALVLERYVTAVPEGVWRAAGLIAVGAGLIGAGISDTGILLLRSVGPPARVAIFVIVFGVFGAAVYGLIVGPLFVSPAPVHAPASATASEADAPQRRLPLGGQRIRLAVLGLVHELELVSGKEFRDEALQMLVGNEQLSSDHQFQTLFALTPNAGFSVVPSLWPVTNAMAALESMLIELTDAGSSIDPKSGARVSGRQVVRGYDAVYLEYQNLISMPWVLNAHKFMNGTAADPNTRFHIVLFGVRPVSTEMLKRFVRTLDDVETALTKP